MKRCEKIGAILGFFVAQVIFATGLFAILVLTKKIAFSPINYAYLLSASMILLIIYIWRQR